MRLLSEALVAKFRTIAGVEQWPPQLVGILNIKINSDRISSFIKDLDVSIRWLKDVVVTMELILGWVDPEEQILDRVKRLDEILNVFLLAKADRILPNRKERKELDNISLTYLSSFEEHVNEIIEILRKLRAMRPLQSGLPLDASSYFIDAVSREPLLPQFYAKTDILIAALKYLLQSK